MVTKTDKHKTSNEFSNLNGQETKQAAKPDAIFLQLAQQYIQCGHRIDHWQQIEPDSLEATHFRKLRESLRLQMIEILQADREVPSRLAGGAEYAD